MPPLRMATIDYSHRHQYSYTEAMLRLPTVEFVALADADSMRQDQAQALVRQFGAKVTTYEDYHDLLANESVEAVVICSPNADHHRMTLDAARAGKHVLCEEPLALTTAQAEEMIQVCEKQGIFLGTAYPCRFAPVIGDMKHRVEAGEIGQILTLSTTNHLQSVLTGWFVDPQLSGGGCIRQQVAHALDLIRWFTGREPVEVYAEAAALARPGLPVEDVGMLIVALEGGLIATIDPSWNRPPSWTRWGDVTLRVLGTEGVIEGDITAQAVSCTTDSTRWLSYGENMDYYLLKSFAESLLARRPPMVTGRDGRMGVAVAEAAYESIRTHRLVPVAA
jgi:myo-inositol 2-dehydrogenase/D-chiro-inositol 1-dehydrogenase